MSPWMRGNRPSPEVQSVEARIVMDLRCARNRTSTPPAILETAAVKSSPKVTAAPIFLCKRAATIKPPEGGPHTSPQPPTRNPFGEDKGGVRHLRNTRVKPCRSVHGERTWVVREQAQHDGGSLMSEGSLVIDEQQEQRQQQQRQQHQQQKEQQQQQQQSRGVVSCRSIGGKPDPVESACRQLREHLSDAAPAPFGSQEYLEKRSRRAARGENVVRQLGQGLEKMSALISEQGARKAQSLVRRLAAEKQRKKALNTSATDSPMPEAVRNIANEERCQRREQKARIGDTQPGKAQRCPWRVGGPSETWGEERIDVDEPRRSVGSRQEGGTVRESSDPINDYATAVVKGILRRACLNLVNRPWRLAGVRLSIDSPSCIGKRRRAREARKDKTAAVAELVKEINAAADGNLTISDRNVFGAAGRGTERRHRRLVRPGTIRNIAGGDPSICASKATRPPFPQRGSNERDIRPHSCGRNIGDELSFHRDMAHGLPEASRAMSENSFSWIPQFEVVGDWDDRNYNIEIGEQTPLNGSPGRPSPRFQSEPNPIFAGNGTGLSFTTNERHRGEGRSYRRDTGAANDLRRMVKSSPRGSRTARTMHRKLGKRPKWDERFWLGATDSSRIRTTIRDTRSSSPQHKAFEDSPGAETCSGLSAPLDNADGPSKLAELKQKHILYEIGRAAALSIGRPLDGVEMVLSELCTAFVSAPTAVELTQPKKLPGTDARGDAFPWPGDGRGSADSIGVVDGSGGTVERSASWNGAGYLCGRGQGPASKPASRGLLLELVESSTGREYHRVATRPGHNGLSPSRSEASIRASPGRLLDGDRARGISTSGGDGGSDRRPVSAPWFAQRPQSHSPRCCSPPTHSGDRADRFLLLTLGFLRRLVEESISSDKEFDGHANVMAALDNIPEIDAEKGLHGRLVDEMSPTSYETLVTIVQQTFCPPSGLQGSSDEDGGDTAIREKCTLGHLGWRTFFGMTVRGVLATRPGPRVFAGICESGGVDPFPYQHSPAANLSVPEDCSTVGDASGTSRSLDKQWATSTSERDPEEKNQTGEADIARVRGCDITVLAEMQRANSHLEFPALAEDARMFAKALTHLAEGGGRD